MSDDDAEMEQGYAAYVERQRFRVRDLPRFLWEFRVEKIGRWSNDSGSGWRFCIRQRRRDGLGYWANCPGPTFLAALGSATSNARRTTPDPRPVAAPATHPRPRKAAV